MRWRLPITRFGLLLALAIFAVAGGPLLVTPAALAQRVQQTEEEKTGGAEEELTDLTLAEGRRSHHGSGSPGDHPSKPVYPSLSPNRPPHSSPPRSLSILASLRNGLGTFYRC